MDAFSKLDRFVTSNRRDSETEQEYIRQVAERCGLTPDEIETLTDAYDKYLFSPDPTPTDEEQTTIEKFVERAEAMSRDESLDEESMTLTTPPQESERVAEATPPTEATTETSDRQQATAEPESSPPTVSGPSHAGTDSVSFPLPNRIARPLSSGFESTFANRSDYWYLSVLAAFGAYVYYLGLGSYPLRTWDEGVYAEAAKNVLLEGAWLAPTVHYHGVHYTVFMEKPPGAFWLEALSMGVFGINEFGARFPSATAAILVGLVLYVFGRRLYDRRAGFLAGLVWLFGPYTFAGYNAGRFGGVEMLTVLVGLLFVYSTWRLATDEDPGRWYLFAGVFAAMAVMIKGFAAGVYVLIVLPLVARSAGRFLRPRFFATVGVTAVLALPWFVFMHLEYGDRFLETIFFQQVLGRTEGELATAGDPTFSWMHFPYIKAVPFFYDPWIFFLLPATVVLGLFAYRRHDVELGYDLAFLVWWAVSVFVFFLFTGNNSWYLLPSYVAGALLVGALFSETSRGTPVATKATLVGLVATLLFSTRLEPLSPFSIEWVWWMPGNVTEGLTYLFGLLTGAAFLLATPRVVAYLREHLHEDDSDIAVTAFSVFAIAVLMVGLIGATPPVMNQPPRFSDAKSLGLDLRQEVPETESVHFETGILEQTGSIFHVAFYSRRSHVQASMPEINGNERVKYAVVSMESLNRIDREHRVLGRYRITARTTGGGEPTVAFVEFD
ncbi:glycosyltransferase family 39 protein [Halogeometricum sp. CBA1124]|uniref:glycosyltransferase family 39 protein n=1 Tax=Halogeometricum sp. CBA1124 TaxID=2668071 RepID=UPI00142B920C|nr:glycosyltransferase family 39 protein [Halogeometricum sp. CBA1124]MUV57241.1 hypothetical protein [Halogeometricum sp. CBA1124]